MKDIILHSRHGNIITKLRYVNDSVYRVYTNSRYTRIGYNVDNTINFIDFEGGPFIAVGSNIEGKIIKNIDKVNNKYLIEFENGSISGKND